MKWKRSLSDQIPVEILQSVISSLLIPLGLLFTTILKTGSYPNKFKEATVLPLYEGNGSYSDSNSYRPISMLSNMSKLFEYILNHRIMLIVEESSLLDDNQHGFRCGRSCVTANTIFSQNVFCELDRPRNMVFVIFVDPKKAFDSIDHVRLLKLLRNVFDLSANLVLVVANFLFDRQIFIKIGKGFSFFKGK